MRVGFFSVDIHYYWNKFKSRPNKKMLILLTVLHILEVFNHSIIIYFQLFPIIDKKNPCNENVTDVLLKYDGHNLIKCYNVLYNMPTL